jgi:NTE family protein
LWNPDGPEPQTISQVQCRAKEIQFASRATSHILAHKQLHQLRRCIGELGQYIPETARSSSAVQELLACGTTMHVVYLTAPRLAGEDQTKDIDFSPAGLRARREAGYADTRRAIARAPWEQQADSIEGVVIHDLVPERPGNQAGRIT